MRWMPALSERALPDLERSLTGRQAGSSLVLPMLSWVCGVAHFRFVQYVVCPLLGRRS